MYLKGIFSEGNQVPSRCVEALWKRSCCSKNTSHYEILLFMTPFFSSFSATFPAPPHLSLEGFWLEREGHQGTRGMNSLLPSRSRPSSINWALLDLPPNVEFKTFLLQEDWPPHSLSFPSLCATLQITPPCPRVLERLNLCTLEHTLLVLD